MKFFSLFENSDAVPRGVWYLGLANLLMNLSSIVAFTFAPLFLKNVLGVTMTALGFFEGFVEAASLFSRIFSGVFSDIFKKRKSFIVAGYFLSIFARAFLALATTVNWVFLSRIFDRVSNGIQASPRDALVSDLSPLDIKGTCFGVRHAMTVAGSMMGAGLGIFLMWKTSNNYRLVFWASVIPAVLALLFLIWGVKEPEKVKKLLPPKKFFRFQDLFDFPLEYWKLITVNLFFMMGHFSGAFLIIDAEQKGISAALVPTIMILQNLVTAVVALPFGRVSDHLDRRLILALGFIVLIISNLVLGFSTELLGAFIGIFLYGLQIGITQSTFLAFVAKTTPAHLQGTGFGVFHFVSGVGVFIANTIAGHLWDAVSAKAAFSATAFFVFIGLLGIPWMIRPTVRQVIRV